MANLDWQDYIILLSFVASIAGLFLLVKTGETPSTEREAADRVLQLMTFAYWLVYCLAVGIQKLTLPDWEILLLSLKFTAILSYFLTFTCVLGLPLHHIAVSQKVQE